PRESPRRGRAAARSWRAPSAPRSSPGWRATRAGSPWSASADPEAMSQGAGAEQEPEDDDAGDRQHRLAQFGRVDAADDRPADPFDDEAERVVFGDRPGRLDHQLVGEEGGGEEEDD